MHWVESLENLNGSLKNCRVYELQSPLEAADLMAATFSGQWRLPGLAQKRPTSSSRKAHIYRFVDSLLITSYNKTT